MVSICEKAYSMIQQMLKPNNEINFIQYDEKTLNIGIWRFILS